MISPGHSREGGERWRVRQEDDGGGLGLGGGEGHPPSMPGPSSSWSRHVVGLNTGVSYGGYLIQNKPQDLNPKP